LAGESIDHLVSVIIFLSVITLFIGLFNQTIQTGVTYQHNKAVASKCSDLLDNMLLSPGIPTGWGQTDEAPAGFGLQAVEFTQYQLSPFSLTRLFSSMGNPVTYNMTGLSYSNITMGFGQSLLVPFSETINYSTASNLLGINGSYGFSLTLTPIVNVTISQTPLDPRSFSINASGPGFPLANAKVNYCFITVTGRAGGTPPLYDVSYGSTTTDAAGIAPIVSFPSFNPAVMSYALIASAEVSGLVGVGYQQHSLYQQSYVVPLVSSIANKTVILAHSWDVTGNGEQDAAISYNATLVILAEGNALREMPFVNQTGSASGTVNSGHYDTLALGTFDQSILIITYSNEVNSGIVVMPWGISALAFPITFGGDPNNKDWVATDMRQVTVNGIAYQAKLSVWSLSGYQVNG